jgi:Cof subfamily protein (haloacid dehalogenase superfamily)
MRKLHVSDLDGTLLNKYKEITDFTAKAINSFIAKGGLFTIATARMPYGCDYKLKKLNLNIPGIVMNGACLYSFNQKEYIDVKSIKINAKKEIKQILNSFKCNAFMYTYENHGLNILYKTDNADLDYSQYLSRRAQENCDSIMRINDFTNQEKSGDVIYFAITGQKRLIGQIDKKVKQVKDIGSSMYLNIYNGYYCLEIFDSQANKANALVRLKELINADAIFVFGDNHNDIGMMEIADMSFAPENAVDEAKNVANEIIQSCDNDGVAKYLIEHNDL